MANDAADRTEEATPRRREKEREKGNVAKSKDLMSSVTVTISLVLLGAFSGWMMNRFQILMHYAFTNLNPKEINVNEFIGLLAPYVRVMAEAVLPFMVATFILTAVSIRLQIGKIFAIDKITPNGNLISKLDCQSLPE